jgi:predicted nucleic acid-binding protein
VYFVDSSALLKAYVAEQGTATVQAAINGLGVSLCVSTIVVLETAAALARLRRTQHMRQKLYARARENFLEDCAIRFHVVHPPESVVNTAVEMIDTYRMRSPGGSDLLHVATAEYARGLFPGRTISLMCCDSGLRSVAEERGFDVFDPLRDPLSALLPSAEAGADQDD